MDTQTAVRNWKLVAGLMASGGSLYLSAIVDEGTGDATVTAVQTTAAGQRKTAVRGSLDAAIAVLAGKVGEKQCRKCKQVKSFEQFSRLANDSPDGFNIYCLACERQRVKDYARRQRNLAEQKAKAARDQR